uniref:Putative reverse transcriptase zinc-binding domain-containing protein n=1 Tax=Helianthus annuus TaxID=4232 RepID=A0A251S8W3_HELAN
MSKSTVFFGNVSNAVKDQITSIMPFEVGVLPVRYLGVPLISSRLLYKDCNRLVENMENRITNWKNRCLSFAGRLQLIRSVLSSMHIYWASVFILPRRIIQDLEEKMRRFLWAQGNDIKGKAKVKWDHVCLPKCEGGLGIRRIADMNNALMVAHIWSLITLRESLWVKWMHSYRIRGRSLWDVPIRSDVTWTWRKLLALRPLVQQHIWTKIGNGSKTLVWFDRWDDVCPLNSFITPRLVANAGFSPQSSVAQVYGNGEWNWPASWYSRFPLLQHLNNIVLNPECEDRIVWKSRSGRVGDYNTSEVWDGIRHVQPEISWANVVWFTQSIPRHSFFMCLLIQKRLKTQDVMSKWYSSGNANFNLLCCSLCTRGPDSHEHLFFECYYATQVWNGVKHRAGMETVANNWALILDHLVLHATSSSATRVIGKLVIGAAAYFVWQERNQRLFSGRKWGADQLIDLILTTVRLKLHTMRFKRTTQVHGISQEWSLPRGLILMDDDCG